MKLIMNSLTLSKPQYNEHLKETERGQQVKKKNP
jgi:hypothetical protein